MSRISPQFVPADGDAEPHFEAGFSQVFHAAEAVCPVHRHVQMHRKSLVRQLKYVRFIGMDICILKEDEIGMNHRKYVRLIGMDVCSRG